MAVGTIIALWPSLLPSLPSNHHSGKEIPQGLRKSGSGDEQPIPVKIHGLPFAEGDIIERAWRAQRRLRQRDLNPPCS
jgi:hypothetical protein